MILENLQKENEHMRRNLTTLILVLTLSVSAVNGMLETGVEDIDTVRASVREEPTNSANALRRQSVLFSWFRHMIHRGIDLQDLHEVGYELAHWGPVKPENYPLVDKAYAIMEGLMENPKYIEEIRGLPAPEDPDPTDWPYFGGSRLQSGLSTDPGPSKGEIAWKFANGHSWYSPAAIEDGRVYITSPGMRTLMYCLDEQSGDVIWKTSQDGLQMYSTPRGASRVVLQKDHAVMRAISGSWEFEEKVRQIYYIDKKTGKVARQVDANRVDYRRGYAPLTGNDAYIAYAYGRVDLRNKPATTIMQDTVVVKKANGQRWWELRIGQMFGDILMQEDLVLAGTEEGLLYALNLEGGQRIRWSHDAGAPIRSTPAVCGGTVLVATQNGDLIGLDRATGKQKWRTSLNQGEPRSFLLFSDPVIENGKVFIGSATRELYCVEASSGKLLWKTAASDWIRSRPLVLGDRIYVAALDGSVTALCFDERSVRQLWTTQAGHHQIFADLSGNENGILASSSELYLYSLNPHNGKIQWRHSLIECTYDNGERVMADIVAGGGDFQSPPTVSNGKVLVGTPSRFVFAVDAETGQEIWRFETSGQVSGCPTVENGRVYFGQQGGNEEMYCVDENTGLPIWSSRVGWVWTTSTPDETQVYTGTVDGNIVALDIENGAPVWTLKTNGGVYPSPAVDEERVYTGSWDGNYYAIDKQSGRLDWVYSCFGGLPDSAAGVIWNGLYICRTTGELAGLDLETGERQWGFTDPRGETGRTSMNSTPSNSGHRTFVSTSIDHDGAALGARLFCIDNRTGEYLWHYTGAGGWTGSSCTENTVICGSSTESFVVCLDVEANPDGSPRILWRTKIGSILEETIPAISGNRAYLLCSDGYLYAFE